MNLNNSRRFCSS